MIKKNYRKKWFDPAPEQGLFLAKLKGYLKDNFAFKMRRVKSRTEEPG